MTNDDQQHATIETVREQFEHWRRTRKKRAAIPDHLWASAIELSARHSVYKIARNLRLNSSDLQKRIQRIHAEPVPEPFQSNFIRLDIDRSGTVEFTIEMSHRNGASMKAHIKNSSLDLLALSKIFLECVK